MRYKFEVKKGPYSKKAFTIEIQEDKFKLWYKDQVRRFGTLCKIDEEIDKQDFMKHSPVFNIDETLELGIMSVEHFEAMDNYLFKTIVKGKN